MVVVYPQRVVDRINYRVQHYGAVPPPARDGTQRRSGHLRCLYGQTQRCKSQRLSRLSGRTTKDWWYE